jgi:F0F1-type ATP synthase assembly protein I
MIAGRPMTAIRHETSVDKERPGIMAFAGLGLLNAICIGVGLVGGWLADQALNTLPLFLFLGLLLGIAVGVYATRSEFKRYF